jgi:hypothetical protein
MPNRKSYLRMCLESQLLSPTATNNIAQRASLGESKQCLWSLKATNHLARIFVARLQRALTICFADPAMLAKLYCWSSSMTRQQQRISKHTLAFIVATLLLLQPQLLFAQTAATSPIKRDSLLEVVRRNLLSTRELIQRVEQRGVAFQMTSEDEAQFRQVGARPELLVAVRANYRGAVVVETKPKPATPPKPETITRPGALGVVTATLTREMSLQAGMNGLTGAMVRLPSRDSPRRRHYAIQWQTRCDRNFAGLRGENSGRHKNLFDGAAAKPLRECRGDFGRNARQ